MKKRILAFILTITLFSSFWLIPVTSAEETPTNEPPHVLSETIDIFPEDREDEGFIAGGGTGHGNNQSRILVHETGIYFSAPLFETGEYTKNGIGPRGEAGIWRLTPDNEVEMLFRFEVYNAPAGTTTNIYADRDGEIWVSSSWDGGTYVAYHYIVEEKRAEKYEWSIVSLPKGTKGILSAGKPGGVMDYVNNRIIQFCVGDYGKRTYIAWNVFDIDTRTWSGLFNVETPNHQTCYHYGYADGKGGFYAISEVAIDLALLPSNIQEGVNLKTALREYHSFFHNAGYIWYNSNMLYVPDAMKPEAYNCTVLDTPYDVVKGIVPNNYNANNDIYLDKETGYLYSIVSMAELGDRPDTTYLQVFDTNQVNEDIQKDGPFKLLAQTELHFLYGDRYFQHMYKDTTGRIYIIANTYVSGEVEIWQATNQPATEFKLVYIEDFRGFMDSESGKNTYSTIIATERNHSIVSDKAHMMVWKDYHGWVYFNVDFAVLRSILSKQ